MVQSVDNWPGGDLIRSSLKSGVFSQLPVHTRAPGADMCLGRRRMSGLLPLLGDLGCLWKRFCIAFQTFVETEKPI